MQTPEDLIKFTTTLNTLLPSLQTNSEDNKNYNNVQTTKNKVNKLTSINDPHTSITLSSQKNTKKRQRKLKQFFCDQCCKCFTTKDSLKVHKRIHSKTNDTFVCKICSKSFQTNQNLKNHVNVHKGLKPFKCEICDRCFSEKSTLTKHKITHSKLRAYSCNQCDKTFTQISAQQRHIQNFHQPQSQPEYGGFLPAFGAEVIANELLLFEDLYDALG